MFSCIEKKNPRTCTDLVTENLSPNRTMSQQCSNIHGLTYRWAFEKQWINCVNGYHGPPVAEEENTALWCASRPRKLWTLLPYATSTICYICHATWLYLPYAISTICYNAMPQAIFIYLLYIIRFKRAYAYLHNTKSQRHFNLFLPNLIILGILIFLFLHIYSFCFFFSLLTH